MNVKALGPLFANFFHPPKITLPHLSTEVALYSDNWVIIESRMGRWRPLVSYEVVYSSTMLHSHSFIRRHLSCMLLKWNTHLFPLTQLCSKTSWKVLPTWNCKTFLLKMWIGLKSLCMFGTMVNTELGQKIWGAASKYNHFLSEKILDPNTLWKIIISITFFPLQFSYCREEKIE